MAALKWSAFIGVSGYGERGDSPAVANGVVYIVEFQGSVYALNASTGAVLWSYSTEWLYRSPHHRQRKPLCWREFRLSMGL